jgi:hypothetical protein
MTTGDVRLRFGWAIEGSRWLQGVIADDEKWKNRTAVLLQLHADELIRMAQSSHTVVRIVNTSGRQDNHWLALNPTHMDRNRTIRFKLLQPNDPAMQAFIAEPMFDQLDVIPEVVEETSSRTRSATEL